MMQIAEPPPYHVIPVQGVSRLPSLLPGMRVSYTYIQTFFRGEVSSTPGCISFGGPSEKATALKNARALLLRTVTEMQLWIQSARSDLGEVIAQMVGMTDAKQTDRVMGLVRGHMNAEQVNPGRDDMDDMMGDAGGGDVLASEEVSQLVQAIVEKCTSRQPRRQCDEHTCSLAKQLERASNSSTPHPNVLRLLANHWDVCSHRIETYFEILPREDVGPVATESRPAAESHQASAERIWVFLMCSDTTEHEISLDHALDRIIARNNIPPSAKFSRSVRAVPVCSFTSNLKILHPDLTEGVLLSYHERNEGPAQAVVEAIKSRAFVDRQGKAVTELTDPVLRSKYPSIGLDSFFGISAIAREPASGSSTRYPAQMEPYTYIKGLHPTVFQDDYSEECMRLHREEVTATTRVRAARGVLRQQEIGLRDSLLEAQQELYTDNASEASAVSAKLDTVTREIGRLNAKLVAVRAKLSTFQRETWSRLDCKWYAQGITLAHLPLHVQTGCFWQLTNLASMAPPLMYSSFIGHWERLHVIRCRQSQVSSVYRQGITGGVASTLTDPAVVDMIPFDQMPEILRRPAFESLIVRDLLYTTMHGFTDEHLPALKSWLTRRDAVLAGDALPETLVDWYIRLRQFALDLVHNVAHHLETDSIFREAVCAGASSDKQLHLFGDTLLKPEYEAPSRRDPTVEAGDEAIQYVMGTAAAGLNVGFTQKPFLLMYLVVLDSTICRATRMKTHLILSGDADAGKSFLLTLLGMISLPGLIVAGGKESACAGFSESAADSGLVGCKGFHEAPKAIKHYKPTKEGGKECDENDEALKSQMAEGRRKYMKAQLTQKPDGSSGIVTVVIEKWAKLAHIIMTNDPLSKIDPTIQSRCICLTVDRMSLPEKSPANFKVSESAEGGIGITGSESNNKDVYLRRFTEFTQRLQLMSMIHGAMRVFAPGVLAPHTGAMNYVYGVFERVLQDMGSKKRPTRAVSQAMSIAETMMQLRVHYADSRRYGPVAAGGLGVQLENYYSKRRTSELRYVLSVGDCVKAVGLVLADDHIHDVLRVLDAISGLLESGKYGFAEVFMEPGPVPNSPSVFTTDSIRYMRFNKYVQTGENTLSSFAKLLVPYAAGMNPDRLLRTLRELERSHSLADYPHHPMDMVMGSESGKTWTALDADDVRQSDVNIFNKMTSVSNFNQLGEMWREIRKDSQLSPMDQLIALPYQQISRTTGRPLFTQFVTVDSYRGEVKIATAAFVDRVNGNLAEKSGLMRKVLKRLETSTTTSRYIGFLTTGIDPGAPHLLDLSYIRHQGGCHEVSINPQFVSDKMHDWMAPGTAMPGVCRDIVGTLRPNVPLDLQYAGQHIERAMLVDPNVFPGAHQMFDSDALGFLIMAPYWARQIVDRVGEHEAVRLWRPDTPSSERRAVIRALLVASPENGGYRDFMRHWCPLQQKDLDPDHEINEDGVPESKDAFTRFVERTTADLECSMSMLDDGTLSQMSIAQTDTVQALKREIAMLRHRARSENASDNDLQIQALVVQLALVEQDQARLLKKINVDRVPPAQRPIPMAWIETREKMKDRPGVHGGAGYAVFVRKWATTMIERRRVKWGVLVDQ